MADPVPAITVKIGKLDDVSKLNDLSEVDENDLSSIRLQWRKDPPKAGYTNLLDAVPLPLQTQSDTLEE